MKKKQPKIDNGGRIPIEEFEEEIDLELPREKKKDILDLSRIIIIIKFVLKMNSQKFHLNFILCAEMKIWN